MPPEYKTMKTIIKFFLIIIIITLIIDGFGGKSVIASIRTSLPILPPLIYLVHILAYSYDIQQDYVALFKLHRGSCTPIIRPLWPALFAAAVGVLLAVLFKNLDAFTLVTFILLALAGYILDARKQFEATAAFVCKLVEVLNLRGR